jgi:hypothetical protein
VRTERILYLSGVAFVAFVVVSLLVGGAVPDVNAPASEVASFYGDEPTRQKIATFVLAASMPFLLIFAASLASFRRANDEEPRPVWRWVLLGGGVVATAMIAAGVLTHQALSDAGGTTAQGLQALNVLDGHAVYALAAALGVMMLGAAGWLVGRERIGWLGWAALVLGVAAFIPLVSILALLLSGAWIVVASVVLFRLAPVETAESVRSRVA